MSISRSIVCIMIVLMLALFPSAQAGVVSLGVAPAPASYVVLKGCTIKIVATASDCDTVDSTCCWDNLTFPEWDSRVSTPVRQADGTYYSETFIDCCWPGTETFHFKADDMHACSPEVDYPAETTFTITTVALNPIDIDLVSYPICPCPQGTVRFVASTVDGRCESEIPWSGGGVPETGTGKYFETYWTTPGTKTVTAGCGCGAKTITVEVKEPYYETSFVDLSGPVGGTTSVKYQVKTRCFMNDAPDIQVRHMAADPWEDLLMLDEVCCTDPDENGITTCTYPLSLWDTIHRITDSYGVERNADMNDFYLLQAKTELSICPYEESFVDTRDTSAAVTNLIVQSIEPQDGLVYWTGEQGTTIPITVHLEDNDFTDPVTLTLKLYDTSVDNRLSYAPAATMQAENVTSNEHTFNWNGTWNGSYGDPLPAGTYTCEVVATQDDQNDCLPCSGIPNPEIGCRAGDVENYRSPYLRIARAADEYGNPIFDVQYDGQDDNGTPDDPEDDDYFYVIRNYRLYDTTDTDASEGVIWLYGPDGHKSDYTWDIADQPCINHENSTDGLHVNLEHALRLRVPCSEMDSDGEYRFVVHIKDAHADVYRNRENRWALDLNGKDLVTALVIVDGDESYLPDVGNSATVDVKVVSALTGKVLNESRVPITVQATPSHLPSTSCNYKPQSSEEYLLPNGSSKPKADLVWKEITSGSTSQIEPDRTKYNDMVSKTIYSSLDTSKPGNAPAYQNGQFTMKFDSFDHGGRIKVAVSKPNDPKYSHIAVQYKDDPHNPKNMTYMWVPWDSDEDRLPDKWEKDQTEPDNLNKYAFDTDDDDDPHTPSSDTGDGLYAFEEYRGFQCKGSWSRFDPKKKDLLIRSPVGTGNVPAATGFAVHEVQDGNDDEMSNENWITRNCYAFACYDYGDTGRDYHQKGICVVLTDVPLDDDENKYVPAWAKWGTPNDVNGVDHNGCVTIHNSNTQRAADLAGVTLEVARTHIITHEVAHSLKLTPTLCPNPNIGGHHHEPNVTDCAMDPFVSAFAVMHNTYCTDCKNNLKLH